MTFPFSSKFCHHVSAGSDVGVDVDSPARVTTNCTVRSPVSWLV